MGGVNTAFGYGVFALFILLNRHFRVCSPEAELVLAPLISQICGILFNFKTTGTIVFRNRNNRLILRFFAVYSITYLLNYRPSETVRVIWHRQAGRPGQSSSCHWLFSRSS